MGRRATCFDNAVSESFFATYKKELIHTRPWNDLTEVRQHTFLWIEGYYNRRRRHSTLGYLTPLEYELGFRKLTNLAAYTGVNKIGNIPRDNWGPLAWWGVTDWWRSGPSPNAVMGSYVVFALPSVTAAIASVFRRKWWELAGFSVPMLLVLFHSGIWGMGRYTASCW